MRDCKLTDEFPIADPKAEKYAATLTDYRTQLRRMAAGIDRPLRRTTMPDFEPLDADQITAGRMHLTNRQRMTDSTIGSQFIKIYGRLAKARNTKILPPKILGLPSFCRSQCPYNRLCVAIKANKRQQLSPPRIHLHLGRKSQEIP